MRHENVFHAIKLQHSFLYFFPEGCAHFRLGAAEQKVPRQPQSCELQLSKYTNTHSHTPKHTQTHTHIYICRLFDISHKSRENSRFPFAICKANRVVSRRICINFIWQMSWQLETATVLENTKGWVAIKIQECVQLEMFNSKIEF